MEAKRLHLHTVAINPLLAFNTHRVKIEGVVVRGSKFNCETDHARPV
jgi:hypothetical protein